MPRMEVRSSDIRRDMQAAKRAHKAANREAALIATDEVSKTGQRNIQAKMKAVRLGRLAGAVGHTSALRKRQKNVTPYGVVYARGQAAPDNRGAAALEAYTRGALIRGKNGKQWLAIATRAVARRAETRGKRMTPALYKKHGWEQRLGKLHFKPISEDRALLVIRDVSVGPKTGRARRAPGWKAKPRNYQREVVAFILIRFTARAKRFDEKDIMRSAHRKMPRALENAHSRIRERSAR